MNQAFLQAERARLASFVDRLNPSVFLIALLPDGTLLHANDAALDLIGARLDDLAGQPLQHTPWWRHARSAAALQDAIEASRRGEPGRIALPIKTAQEQRITVEFSCRAVHGASGELQCLILSGLDIPERHRAAAPDAITLTLDPDRELKDDLREAVRHNQLQLLFQPQLAIDTGAIVGVEALLRWQHAQLGNIAPERFMPLAENAGLTDDLGDWALRRACLVARKWQREGLPALRMMVNVASGQLQAGLASRVERLLAETGLDPRRLGLELTEPVLVRNLEGAIAQLEQLRRLGVAIALDEYGSSVSNLEHLCRLPLDQIKMDRALVPDADGGKDRLPVARAAIALGHALGLQVLADGVTNDAQLSALADSRCDLLQGCHFSGPMPAEQIVVMLREGRSLALPRRSPRRPSPARLDLGAELQAVDEALFELPSQLMTLPGDLWTPGATGHADCSRVTHVDRTHRRHSA